MGRMAVVEDKREEGKFRLSVSSPLLVCIIGRECLE